MEFDKAGYADLRIMTGMYFDAEALRVSEENRLAGLVGGNANPGERAKVLLAIKRGETNAPEPLVEWLRTLEEGERSLENSVIAKFKAVVPKPLVEWTEATPGLGLPTMARLIGLIGHPRIALPREWDGEGKDRVLLDKAPFERSLRQLWAYCGYGDPLRKPTKELSAEGFLALGNRKAKVTVFLMAKATSYRTGKIGDRSPFRDLYEDIKEEYATRVHAVECRNTAGPNKSPNGCGRMGVPAPVGSPWMKGHQDQAALRLIGKEILREVWLNAKD